MSFKKERRRGLQVTGAAAAVLLVTSAAALAAGNSNTTAGTSAASVCSGPVALSTYKSTNPTPLSAAAGLAEAKRLVREEESTKTAAPPTTPVNASLSKGKTVFVIPVLGTIPVAQITNKALTDALALAGAKTVAIDGQGQVSVWTRGIQEAIGRHVDGLALEAIATKVVQAPVQRAHSAGIKIVQGFEWDAGCPPATEQQLGVMGQVTYSYVEMGKRLADFTIADSNGKANAIFITSSDVFTSGLMLGAAQDEFKRLCPGCTLKVVDSPQTNPPSYLQTLTRTLIQKNPNAGYMIPVFDAMALHMVPEIHAANAAGRIKIVTTNGTPAALALIKAHNVIAADIGANIAWSGWGIADEFFRAFANQPGIADENVPTRTFDSNNINQINLKADQSTWFGGTGWQQQFKKTWGLG